MDTIIENFAGDERLGLVFPSDPHLADWDMNGVIAEQLAAKMGLEARLPGLFQLPSWHDVLGALGGPCSAI